MHIIAAAPAVLAASAFAIPLIYLKIKSVKVFHIIALLVTSATFFMTLSGCIYVSQTGEPIVYRMGGWPPPLGIVYEADNFSTLLATYTALIIVFVTLYSSWYLGHDPGAPYYYSLLFGLEAGLLGIYYTGDIFNLFVMLEVLGITCYGLVAYYRNNKEAVEASIKYAFFGALAGLSYFLATVITYASFGNLTMGFVAAQSRPTFRSLTPFVDLFTWGNIVAAVAVILALSLWTFTYKAGIFPNHFWLPDAHPAAPTPISAVLSGLVVNAGAYASARFLYTVFGVYDPLSSFHDLSHYLGMILSALGAFSAIFASVMMLVQNDVKRLIAYSTIMHLGLIFTGFSLGTSTGAKAAIYHTLTHAAGKALLFMSAGVAIEISKTRKISDIRAIGRLSPIVGISITAACFSLVGLPPLGGFFSKFALYQAYIEVGRFDLVAVLLASSAIAMLGYLKVIYPILFGSQTSSDAETNRLGDPSMLLPLAALVTLLIILNPLVIGPIIEDASRSLVHADEYIRKALEAFVNYVTLGRSRAGG